MKSPLSAFTRNLFFAASLSAAPTLWADDPPFTFTSFAQSISENFNTYQGTADTLPSDMFTSDSLGEPDNFRGIGDFNDPESPYGNFSAYTSEGEDFSFGIRERSPDSGFRDARLFLPIKNATGQPIRYFLVSYDVEAWFVGNRRNRIRMKYDNFVDPIDAGRETFETDIFSTDSPSAETTPDTRVDGSLAANRTTVEGIVDLAVLDDGYGNFFGSLPDGETAWFRWQFSNAAGDGGSLRSGLAINNLVITPLESFTELEWKPGVGGGGAWETTGGTSWSDGEWAQGAGAIFAGTPGVVTLDGDIEAFTVNLKSAYTLDAQPDATLFVDIGLAVDSGVSATLNAPIRADGQLRKIGGGTLLLGGGQNHSGPTNLVGGTLRPLVDDVTSANGPLMITPGGVFDLNGTTQTIGGLNGERGGLVTLGTGGTLVIDTPAGNYAYRADLEGAGNVIKTGPGRQRFRSEKKLYTGFTRIEGGTLEVTGNGEMTETSVIEVMPGGELFMVGSSSSGPPQGFGGPVQLHGGSLAVENTGDEALYFADFTLDVRVADSTIDVDGSQSILIMNAEFDGVIAGNALVRKTGAGQLELAGNHPHQGGMEILSGSLLMDSDAMLAAGTVTIGSGASIAGSGTLGGSLVLMEGAALNTDPEIGGPLTVSGEFSAGENALVAVSGTLSVDTFTILTASGGITGADQLAITGLAGTGFSGSLEVVGNDLLLHIVEAIGITYDEWAGGVDPNEDTNGNGFPALLEFAFGADAPGGTFTRPVQGMAAENGVDYLTLTAIVRTNAPDLVVAGETAVDLDSADSWDSGAVDHIATGKLTVPPDTEERIYRTPVDGAVRFIRLRASAPPAP